mgnify:CR=1 FL=1
MELLLFMALTGLVSGIVSGAYVGGQEGLILGGSIGLVCGVLVWSLTGFVSRALRERRLNRYFNQDGGDLG